MSTIRCAVKSCHYWGEGEYCSADQIWVKNDVFIRDTGMEIGAIGGKDRTEMKKEGKNAKESSETFCETFKPKETGKMS